MGKRLIGSVQHINEARQSESIVEDSSDDESVVECKGMSIFRQESRKGSAEFRFLKFFNEEGSRNVYLAQ